MGVPGVASGNTNRHGAYTHICLVVKESLTSSATQTHQLKKQNVCDLEIRISLSVHLWCPDITVVE
jgi:hypothetical protein